MQIRLNKEILDKIDLNPFYHHLTGNSLIYFNLLSGQEHYRLLVYLSTLFHNKVFSDLGTFCGGSAVALSANPNNFVFSFDQKDRTEQAVLSRSGPILNPSYLQNIDYIVSQNFFRYLDIIVNSSLILVDVDHSGTLEKKLIETLIDKKYRGIVIMDDILQFKELTDLWNSLNIKKYDITKYGHFSGTGILIFNDDDEVIIE